MEKIHTLKLSKELKEMLKKELEKDLPDFPSEIDVSESTVKITGLCVTVTDNLFIEIEDEEHE